MREKTLRSTLTALGGVVESFETVPSTLAEARG